MSKGTEKHIALVALFGAIGGILAWTIGIWRGQPPHVSVWLDSPLSLVLGAGASIVFVFLISNTDRSDRARLIALALVAGVFWEPVWEASQALVDREVEQSRQKAAVEATQKAATLAASLQSASPAERDRILEDIRQELQKAEHAARGIDSVSGLRRVSLASEQLLSVGEDLPRRELRTLLATLDPIESRYFSGNASIASATPVPAGGVVPLTISQSDLPTGRMPLLTAGARLVFSDLDAMKAWFRLAIQTRSTTTLRIKATDADLVAAIYSRESLQLVKSDDDSGGDLNPEIRADLATGEYIVRISSTRPGSLPRFEIRAIIEATRQ